MTSRYICGQIIRIDTTKSFPGVIKEILTKTMILALVNKLFSEEKNLHLSQIHATKVRRSQLYWSSITLADVYEMEYLFKKKFPNNNTIKDSMRRNLQGLRDLGLIKFLGNGNYKKLWL